MDVREAVIERRSVRGFLDRPVDLVAVERLVRLAARAPSGGNVQPWHITLIGGEALGALKAAVAARIESGVAPTPAYAIYPPALHSPYRDRRFAVGEQMYQHVGIPREDKAARRAWFANNFRFFGAPAALFCTVDRRMGPPQWSDLGMYLQTLMLLLVEEGLASCPQECWAVYPETVTAFLDTPAEHMLFCGMAIGYEDRAAAANALRTERADPAEWLTIRT